MVDETNDKDKLKDQQTDSEGSTKKDNGEDAPKESDKDAVDAAKTDKAASSSQDPDSSKENADEKASESSSDADDAKSEKADAAQDGTSGDKKPDETDEADGKDAKAASDTSAPGSDAKSDADNAEGDAASQGDAKKADEAKAEADKEGKAGAGVPEPDMAVPAAAPEHADAPEVNAPSSPVTYSTQDAAPKSPKSAREAIEPETPPPPPTRSKAVRHPVVVFMNFMLSVLLLAVIAAAGLLYYGKQTFIEAGPLTQEKTILVSSGTGLGTIAGILERQNVIENATIFEYGVRIYQQDAKLKAGEYLFSPGISMHQVMNILTSGKSILHAVTVPEGYTSAQVVDVLRRDDVLVGEIDEVPPEGSILPETYKFSRGTTRQDILDRMMAAHDRAVDEIWARRAPDLPLEDKEQLVTLASIIEKETGQASERTRVAGVFVNRLNQGMRLQSDPTVIYGIFGGEGKPSGRPIYRSDLDKKTPYNTYQITGLTPGPIANPGRAALEAAANPSRTNDLFFVADGTGGHVFAETLDQHNLNVRRWREIERKRIEALESEGSAAEGDKGAEGTEGASEEAPAQ